MMPARKDLFRSNLFSSGKLAEYLNQFEQSGTFESAERFRRLVLPQSVLYDSQRCSDGKWTVELRFDDVLHHGEGQTEAAALVDAVVRIMRLISGPSIAGK